MSKVYTPVPYSGYGSQGLQVFTPREIIVTNNLDTTEINAIRIPEATSYTINGTGASGTMPAGCTGIAAGVTSIAFGASIAIEVM